MKQRGLGVIGFLVSAVVAAPALSHDCRVRDVAGYLRGGGYEGDCDESETAHGHGEAKGADTYVGDFVNGWPEGKGTYTWENGARLEGTSSGAERTVQASTSSPRAFATKESSSTASWKR